MLESYEKKTYTQTHALVYVSILCAQWKLKTRLRQRRRWRSGRRRITHTHASFIFECHKYINTFISSIVT